MKYTRRRQKGGSALHDAVRNGNLDTVRTLLQYGENPNMISYGSTALHRVAAYHDYDENPLIISELIQNGANPNIKDKDGNTPLHVYIPLMNIDIIETILSEGADPNIQNNNGETPLHFAAKYGLVDIVKMLLINGANPTIKSSGKYGETPLGFIMDDDYYRGKLNNVEKIAELLENFPPEKEIPTNTQNIVSLNNIKTGNIIANIPSGTNHKYNSEFDRYYLKKTINGLYNSQGSALHNPATRSKFRIKNVKYYKAKQKPQTQGGKHGSRHRSNTRKVKKGSKRDN